VALMIVLSLTWPPPRAFTEAIAAANAPAGPTHVGPTPEPPGQARPGRHRATAPHPGTMEP
jgi:hypothetical protein